MTDNTPKPTTNAALADELEVWLRGLTDGDVRIPVRRLHPIIAALRLPTIPADDAALVKREDIAISAISNAITSQKSEIERLTTENAAPCEHCADLEKQAELANDAREWDEAADYIEASEKREAALRALCDTVKRAKRQSQGYDEWWLGEIRALYPEWGKAEA